MAQRALFLDRDGVINHDHGYVATSDRFDFVDGILETARHAVDRGWRVVVVTNQSGIARGYYDEAGFTVLTDWMCARFAEAGAPLTGVLHCPYLGGVADPRYDRNSFWRKPNPGMILEAAWRFGIAPERSILLGDQPTDLLAARSAGVPGRYLILSEVGRAAPEMEVGLATGIIHRPTELIPAIS